jgi:hypothetical protein
LDACTADCVDVAAAIACCITAHGRGDFGADDAARLASNCSGEGCDQDLYLSADAAVCAAQVQGLVQGTSTCNPQFSISNDQAAWLVVVIIDPDTGLAMQLDALSGEFIITAHVDLG